MWLYNYSSNWTSSASGNSASEQSPPATIKAHFKPDFRTGWLNKLLYFTDERMIEKQTPQCFMANVPSAVNGGAGREWVMVGGGLDRHSLLTSRRSFIHHHDMRWDQLHQPQPEQFWKTPATGALQNKAREQRIISALHDIIVLNNGGIPGLYST